MNENGIDRQQNQMRRAVCLLALCLSFHAASGRADELAEGFANPPAPARPHTFWHLMKGNTTEEGITADLEAMSDAGVGGVSLTNCTGWTTSGGPWVRPEKSMMRVAWSEQYHKGPGHIAAPLPMPPCDCANYQNLTMARSHIRESAPPEERVHRDVAVLAYPLEPAAVDKPLIAYWTFDEDFGHRCADAAGNGWDATPHVGTGGLARTEGLFGNAMRFSGRHFLRTPGKAAFGELDQIALSAWVLPTGFATYNEIFRKEDGDNRVLFSFQSEGNILSLGLNLGGYVECDAKIRPEQLLDGQWHHCAGTFDGATMRVYLDGVEVGAVARPGSITTGDAPGCIGSTNGRECFQGLMDDLRIYRQALTADEVRFLVDNGRGATASMAELVPADEPAAGASLVSHWTFNERGATTVIHDAVEDGALNLDTSVLGRTRGVHGNALRLEGAHRIPVAIGPKVQGLSELTLSAWAKPSDLSGHREIFRQECRQRLLFSFQESGSILSFGVDAGGYAECDARIAPDLVLDGQWHHCAATFDGRAVRVYFDGAEVGSMERTERLAASSKAPAFIASSSGTGEHFQGALDDLRIYGQALTAEQIASLHAEGRASLAQYAKEQEERLVAFYADEATFAETLAKTRENLVEKDVQPTRELVEAAVIKVRAGFPDESAQFVQWTGLGMLEYLVSDDAGLNQRLATRLVDLLLEYRPLTEHQWASQAPEERERWNRAEAIGARLASFEDQGETARYSPEWVRIMLEAGPHIDFRPVMREPVAPYRRPTTPETRTLTMDEGLETLERDWMFQAGDEPTPEWIRNEIGWTRALAARILAAHAGAVQFDEELAELDRLAILAEGLDTADKALYLGVRTVKRRIMFRNPVIDFDRMLFVDMPFPQGSEWPHETRHRLGYMAVPGARLVVLDGLSPAGELTQLMPQAPLHGSFWRPDLSFDAERVLFCFKPHNEKSFHLYEINVDGTGLRQITDGIYDDLDPIYLPDGEHIFFSTTRGHTYVRCMPPTNAFVLARCDLDGENMYLISRGNEPDYTASVMHDGRVLYTRWEYTDKPLWRAQSLWTMHPDGTQVNVFWGNQSVWPDLLKDARSIPGSDRVMFTGSAHHNWFNGSVGIVEPNKGLNFPDGLTKITADVEWPESGNGPVDPIESPRYHASGQYTAYYSPYPLSEQDFLVSANRGGKFLLYLMDVNGNRELIYEGAHNIFHALPLKARPRPPVIHELVDWPTAEERETPKGGVIYSNNVYHRAPEVLRGKAKYLRILNIEHKTYSYWHKRPYLSTGPVVSGVQSEGVKRVLGTVPIEADGSVSFHAPSGIPLHFQLLDDNHRALQTMRSFTGLMPGERRGCLGCHERHNGAPLGNVASTATKREPSAITPPPWGEDSVSFARYVRPVLDAHCGKCHQGDGKGREKIDFTPRPGHLGFDQAYWLLTGQPAWGSAYNMPKNPPPGFGIADMLMVEGYDTRDPKAYVTPEPMTKLSYKSRLIEMVSSGEHHGVKLDEVSLRRLILWIDTMCPYRGTEEVRAIPDPEFQGIDWLAIRPEVQSAPRIVRPGPL